MTEPPDTIAPVSCSPMVMVFRKNPWRSEIGVLSAKSRGSPAMSAFVVESVEDCWLMVRLLCHVQCRLDLNLLSRAK